MLELICRTLDNTRVLPVTDPASALNSLAKVDCLAILATPSQLPALREGVQQRNNPVRPWSH